MATGKAAGMWLWVNTMAQIPMQKASHRSKKGFMGCVVVGLSTMEEHIMLSEMTRVMVVNV